MNEPAVTTLLDGLVFPGAPRWHAGRLWFCDIHAGQVWATTQHAQRQPVCVLDGEPTGLGWDPDGHLLVVTARDRVLWRLVDRRLDLVARLDAHFPHDLDSLVVDPGGRAYVGSTGFDATTAAEPGETALVAVDPDGRSWVAAEGLRFPNGTALTADGTTLVVAETMAQRLLAFTVGDDGALHSSRVWADLAPNVPGGLCLDAEGGAWVADPVAKGVLRVVEGGVVTDWVPMPEGRAAYACALGGADQRTLFVCSAETSDRTRTAELRAGRIEVLTVEVPGVDAGPPEPEAATTPPVRPSRQRAG